jgi:hypothetical protein
VLYQLDFDAFDPAVLDRVVERFLQNSEQGPSGFGSQNTLHITFEVNRALSVRRSSSSAGYMRTDGSWRTLRLFGN